MPLHVFIMIAVVVGGATAFIIAYRSLRRRAIRNLVRTRFYSGHCIMCGADLRFGKEEGPKCGYKYDWVAAMVWEDVLERRKMRQRSGDTA